MVHAAWTIDQWFTAPDIATGYVDEATAVDLIINTYQSATGSLGDELYGFTGDDVRGFLTADTYHKKIDIAEITEYAELNFDRRFDLKNTDTNGQDQALDTGSDH